MAHLKELIISLTDWEVRTVLGALSREKERLKTINATSEDEDLAADAGNDYSELAGFEERIAVAAVAVFGEQIIEF